MPRGRVEVDAKGLGGRVAVQADVARGDGGVERKARRARGEGGLQAARLVEARGAAVGGEGVVAVAEGVGEEEARLDGGGGHGRGGGRGWRQGRR